jgi:hypothetical protein
MMKRILAACLALPLVAEAGRPLVTEDARTLDNKACQLESWVDRTQGRAIHAWAVPACTYAGVEVQVGGERTRENGKSAATTVYTQGKYAFRSVDEGPWGAGIVVGLQRSPRREEKNDWGDAYMILPFSFWLGADDNLRPVVHLNVGTTRVRDEGRNLTLWGAAWEMPLTDRLTVLGETYGENAAKPFFRLGGRYTVVDKVLDVDLTYVMRSGGTRDDRLWSLGFHWQTAPLLP